MKILYALLIVPLISFSCQPPADQTPRIGQTNAEQELLVQKNEFESDLQVLRALIQLEDILNPRTVDKEKLMNQMSKMYANPITVQILNTIHPNDKTEEKKDN